MCYANQWTCFYMIGNAVMNDSTLAQENRVYNTGLFQKYIKMKQNLYETTVEGYKNRSYLNEFNLMRSK